MDEAAVERWAYEAAKIKGVVNATPATFFNEQWVLVDVKGHGVYWCNRVRHLRWLQRQFGTAKEG